MTVLAFPTNRVRPINPVQPTNRVCRPAPAAAPVAASAPHPDDRVVSLATARPGLTPEWGEVARVVALMVWMEENPLSVPIITPLRGGGRCDPCRGACGRARLRPDPA